MAQTGYTPILIYSSSTVSQAPSAGNLTNSTLGSELAINITDGKLFYKDNANAVQVIAWKTTPTTAGGTGLTSYTAGDMLYYASGTTLTKLAIGVSGRWLGSSGTAPQWNAPAALTKTDDTNVTLTLGGNASTALLNAASLTLGWTGQLATNRGGTGLSSFTANGILYATSTSALTTGSALTFDGSLVVPQSAIGTSGTVGFRANDTTNSKNIQMFRAGSGYNYIGIVGTQGVIYSIDQLTIAADTSSPIWFSTGGALRGGWSGSGGFSIGNTTDPGAGNLYVNNDILSGTSATTGSASNVRRITGGRFSTINGSGFTANNGVATTMFTLTNTSDSQTWLVCADLQGESSSSYACVYVVTCINNSVTNATLLVKGSLASISVSGLNVQYTQSSGGNKTNTQYSAIRIM